MKVKLIIIFVLCLAAQNVSAQSNPKLPEIDRVRIAEGFRIGQKLGNKIWKNWDKVPFAVLLVTPENEFLIRHPKPSKDFTSIGYDPHLKSDVYYRKRIFGTNLLATFPAVGGVSTIVIGQAENTAKNNSTDWVVTLLHEHFHQLQTSQPNYYTDVNALDLSGGDETGMWMLNYAFPYSTPEVNRQFNELSKLLNETLLTQSKKEFLTKTAEYLAARQKFNSLLKPNDYKYFSFQVWQEGTARYTEYRIAELAARKYQPTKEFRALKDYRSFRVVADQTLQNIMDELKNLKLEEYQRTAFYPLGAGEALLLDRTNPQWKSLYFSEKFYLDKYFKTVR